MHGLYQHYKGGLYWVLGIAKHSETLEDMVVYEPKSAIQNMPDNEKWVRPLSMFTEEIDYRGEWVPRFRKIETKRSE